jgi:hypothetical protein
MKAEAPTPAAIRKAAADVSFSGPLIQNDFRGIIAEIIVHHALGSDWEHSSGAWNGWDFTHKDGTRLEVKQSARKQTWADPKRIYPPRFNIKTKTGYWENGINWIPKLGRHADIYVFAYHPVADCSADHCDPLQWLFYVIPTTELPEAAQSISLATLNSRLTPLRWDQLFEAIDEQRRRLAAE